MHSYAWALVLMVISIRRLLSRRATSIDRTDITRRRCANNNARWPAVIFLIFMHLPHTTTVRWLPSRSMAHNNIAGHPGLNNNARWRTVTSSFLKSYRDACRPFYGIRANFLNTTQPAKAVRYGKFASTNPLALFK